MEGFGLWTTSRNRMESAPVALTGVRFTTRVTAVGQRTVVEQVFLNREERAIEALYTFPLPEGAAVCGFEVITGDRVLTGEIEELSKGIEKYEEAVSEGHGAFMAELWRPDVFSTRVGNIKPGQAVLIRLTYAAEVEVAERKLRLALPTTLAPRYGTATGMDIVEAVLESEALNPPHVLAVPYGLELSVELDLGLKLKSVGSATHAVRVEHGDGDAWRVTLSGGRAEMNRAVVIEAELAKEAGAKAWAEEGLVPEEKFVAVSFLPEFEVEELDAVPAREVVFVLDCSGSMEGPSIEQAKRALALCLKCLNEGDRFNICRFGDRHEMMKPGSVLYTQATLDGALMYLGKTRADLGGTELYAPLEEVLRGAGRERLREIVVLTDGQVTNEPALVKLAGGFRGRARIFSFGIGPASSEFLVRGIARATGGASDFVAPGERIEEKVLRMFGRMASPRLEDVEVTWQGAEADMEPRWTGGLFDGEPLRVSARVRGALPREVTLKARWKGREKEWRVAVPAASVRHASERAASPVAASWVRARLAALELADAFPAMPKAQRRETAVGLSKRYGVLSRETTFVAVEHRSLEERTRGMPALRRVPVMLAEGWGGEMLAEEATLYCRMAPAAPAPAGGMAAAFSRGAPGGLRRRLNKLITSAKKRKAASADFDALTRADAESDDSVMFGVEATAGESGSLLEKLLMSQTAEGWFGWEDDLAKPVLNGKPWKIAEYGPTLDALLASLDSALKTKVRATALMLRAFEDCFPDDADLWRLAAAKARRWIEKASPEAAAWSIAKT